MTKHPESIEATRIPRLILEHMEKKLEQNEKRRKMWEAHGFV